MTSRVERAREALDELKRLLSSGTIDRAEFAARRSLILEDLNPVERAALVGGGHFGPSGAQAEGLKTAPRRRAEIDFEPGDQLFGQWRIERPLGRGGFGVVFEATELHLDQRQAVKVLDPKMVENAALLAKFRREVMLARELVHRRIVRVYDYRESIEESLAMLSMELVSGCSLAELRDLAWRESRPLPVARVLEIVAELAEALAVAHARGIVHRDISPGNVLLAGGEARHLLDEPGVDSDVRLADFGIAAFLDRVEASARSGRALGPFAYAAPELSNPNARVTPAADVYGIGAVAYELLTGFQVVGRVHAPRRHRVELSAAVDELILALLEQNPAERPAVAEVERSARQLLADERREVERLGRVSLLEVELERAERVGDEKSLRACLAELADLLGAGATANRRVTAARSWLDQREAERRKADAEAKRADEERRRAAAEAKRADDERRRRRAETEKAREREEEVARRRERAEEERRTQEATRAAAPESELRRPPARPGGSAARRAAGAPSSPRRQAFPKAAGLTIVLLVASAAIGLVTWSSRARPAPQLPPSPQPTVDSAPPVPAAPAQRDRPQPTWAPGSRVAIELAPVPLRLEPGGIELLRRAARDPASAVQERLGVLVLKEGDLWFLRAGGGASRRITAVGGVREFTVGKGAIYFTRAIESQDWNGRLLQLQGSNVAQVLSESVPIWGRIVASRLSGELLYSESEPDWPLPAREDFELLGTSRKLGSIRRFDPGTGTTRIVVGRDPVEWPLGARPRREFEAKTWAGSTVVSFDDRGGWLIFSRTHWIRESGGCTDVFYRVRVDQGSDRGRAVLDPTGGVVCMKVTDAEGGLAIAESYSDRRGLFVVDLAGDLREALALDWIIGGSLRRDRRLLTADHYPGDDHAPVLLDPIQGSASRLALAGAQGLRWADDPWGAGSDALLVFGDPEPWVAAWEPGSPDVRILGNGSEPTWVDRGDGLDWLVDARVVTTMEVGREAVLERAESSILAESRRDEARSEIPGVDPEHEAQGPRESVVRERSNEAAPAPRESPAPPQVPEPVGEPRAWSEPVTNSPEAQGATKPEAIEPDRSRTDRWRDRRLGEPKAAPTQPAPASWLDERTGLRWTVRDNGRFVTWSEARTYCDDLPRSGELAWRLPTLLELKSLYDAETSRRPRVRSPITLSMASIWAFEQVGIRGDDGARYFHFGTGRDGANPAHFDANHALCVVEGPEDSQPAAAESRKPSAQVVRTPASTGPAETWTDARTGLVWTAKDNGADLSWFEAESYCSALGVGGFTDWRLPSVAELRALYQFNVKGKKYRITGGIEIERAWIWSGDFESGSPMTPDGYLEDVGRYSFGMLGDGVTWSRRGDKRLIRALCVRP